MLVPMKPMLAVVGLAILVIGARLLGGAPMPVAVRAPTAGEGDTPQARGRLVYTRYGCAMCHGAEGKGGVANPNAETGGKIPEITHVAEGYTLEELRRLILKGTPTIGRANPNGPRPPLRMPGWRDRMTDREAVDLAQYLISLEPKSAGEKWR
jgi:mono/diheme cytochrome c family protein